MSYFQDIQDGIRTTLKGLSLTLRHLRNATHRRTPEGIASDNYFELQNGLVTLQYPHEQLPIPDNGRYQLRNEIEDCIVCDKCAKICPVDCITIDAIKATEEVGRASDGSPIRLYAAKFDIDMAKCCYCGLCTVVCPTECLTMDKKFDYSEFELGKLTYSFAELTPEQADEKRALYEQFVREKEEAKAAQAVVKAAQTNEPAATPAPKRPVFRPTAKPTASAPPDPTTNSTDGAIVHPLTDATPDEMQQIAQGGLEATKRPVFRPKQKPVAPAPTDNVEPNPAADKAEPATPAKPAFRPTMKPPKLTEEGPASEAVSEVPKPKPAFRPTMKPAAPIESEELKQPDADVPKAKPAAYRPTMKPKAVEPDLPASEEPQLLKAKPAFKPTMKPTKPITDESPVSNSAEQAQLASPSEDAVEPPKPKPAFRPTMKPKPGPSASNPDQEKPS
ncbi:4Fe-4S dicluster domain-containing protein [Spirosoma soli]|uniref:4Fe-4S dicluster domain-containing protein n=1 Tax=Spirosoma soli TaxID=1770529 RepID=A0ABW5M2Q9_9BACT